MEWLDLTGNTVAPFDATAAAKGSCHTPPCRIRQFQMAYRQYRKPLEIGSGRAYGRPFRRRRLTSFSAGGSTIGRGPETLYSRILLILNSVALDDDSESDGAREPGRRGKADATRRLLTRIGARIRE
jgi:hypothetical protein